MKRLGILLLVTTTVLSVFGAFTPRAYAWDVAAYPSSRTTVPGGTVTYSVSVFYQYVEAPPSSVSLLVSPSLVGVTASFSPENGTMSFNSLMSVHVDDLKPPGIYTLSIWAHPDDAPFPGPDNRATDVQLIVQSATPGITDWALSNPSLSPASPNVGDSVTFHVIITALSTNQPHPQSVTLLAQIDDGLVGGGTIEYPGPTGNPIYVYSTPPWMATEGTHTIAWKATSGLHDPNTSNNQVSFVFTVGQSSQQFDFTILVTPLERTVTKSGMATYTVTVNRLSGTSQTVALSLVGEPLGVTETFGKPSSKPTFSSSLTLTVAESTSAGTFTLVVIGVGGGKTRSATLTLIVVQPSDFKVQANPSSVTVGQGQVVPFFIEVIGMQGFNSPVSLSISGLPKGSDAIFSVKSGKPHFVSILTVTLPSHVEPGSFVLTIRASGEGLTRTTDTTLIIVSPVHTKTVTQTQTTTLTQTPAQTTTATTQTHMETSTRTETQTETRTETTYAIRDLLDVIQENSLVVIGILVLIIVLLAAAAFRT